MTTWLLGVTALACALMGGIFFAFSSFIMPALSRISIEEGIHAMQRINVDVYHWTFMSAFFLTPIACIITAVLTFRSASTDAAIYAVIGCAAYVLGNFVVTAAGNVPLNNALAAVDVNTSEAARDWSQYISRWTRWNHVRTVASMFAAGSFVVALTTI